MTQTPHSDCERFLEQLDAWLEGDYSADHMRAHHDACASCRKQTQLARAIRGITSALPQLRGPDIHVRSTKPSVWTQLLHTWRQPLVFVPALALAIALLAWPQLRAPQTAVEPELVIIDGRAYTREEIRKAAEDLQLALRYIDRYRPGRVISAELDTGEAPTPASGSERNDGDLAPTI